MLQQRKSTGQTGSDRSDFSISLSSPSHSGGVSLSQPSTPMPLLRVIDEPPTPLGPAPGQELRRASRQTVEEPLGEPIPSTPSTIAASRKKSRTEDARGVVRKRVDELEEEKGNHQDFKKIGQGRKASSSKRRPSTPRTPASCLGTPGQPSTLPATSSSAQGTIAAPQASEVEIPHSDGDEAEFPSFFQHLCGELGSTLESVEEEAGQLGWANVCFATVQPDVKNGRMISKPWNTKNGEFNVKEAAPEDVRGFELSCRCELSRFGVVERWKRSRTTATESSTVA